MEEVQMAMEVAVTRDALDFQAGMSSALINGTIQKGAEMAEQLSRSAGLAAAGIGTRLDAVV